MKTLEVNSTRLCAAESNPGCLFFLRRRKCPISTQIWFDKKHLEYCPLSSDFQKTSTPPRQAQTSLKRFSLNSSPNTISLISGHPQQCRHLLPSPNHPIVLWIISDSQEALITNLRPFLLPIPKTPWMFLLCLTALLNLIHHSPFLQPDPSHLDQVPNNPPQSDNPHPPSHGHGSLVFSTVLNWHILKHPPSEHNHSWLPGSLLISVVRHVTPQVHTRTTTALEWGNLHQVWPFPTQLFPTGWGTHYRVGGCDWSYWRGQVIWGKFKEDAWVGLLCDCRFVLYCLPSRSFPQSRLWSPLWFLGSYRSYRH